MRARRSLPALFLVLAAAGAAAAAVTARRTIRAAAPPPEAAPAARVFVVLHPPERPAAGALERALAEVETQLSGRNCVFLDARELGAENVAARLALEENATIFIA